jgi:hypothetical protein
LALVGTGVDPKEVDDQDPTPLQWGAEGRIGLIRPLVEAGVDPKQGDDSGAMALDLAGAIGRLETIRAFVGALSTTSRVPRKAQRDSCPNQATAYGIVPPFEATSLEQAEPVEAPVKVGADIKARNASLAFRARPPSMMVPVRSRFT